MTSIRSYALVTGAYWGFTITDGALRMLVVLHFYRLGYDAVSIAFLFLFYEFFGIVTNLFGGWIASRSGVKVTLIRRTGPANFFMLMLAMLNEHWTVLVSVVYVMIAQALSGIAKDLTKMSSKSAIKVVVPEGQESALFKWVARLTGSKNALKGLGFFVGGALLAAFGFVGALVGMARRCWWCCWPRPPRFRAIWALKEEGQVHVAAVEEPGDQLAFGRPPVSVCIAGYLVCCWLARVSQPNRVVRLVRRSFLALWVIGYGLIQAAVPEILHLLGNETVDGSAARLWAFVLVLVPASLAWAMRGDIDRATALMIGLAVFAVVFAINSAVHSYLVLAYTDKDRVALDVGFYYMANAGGRLLGTLASGVVFQFYGLVGCLWGAAVLVLAAAVLSLGLPRGNPIVLAAAGAGESE